MPHIVVFDRLAFQKVKLDDQGNRTIEPDGPEVIVTKGHRVPEWVPDWQLVAFMQSGMITGVAEIPEVAPAPQVGPVPPAQSEPDGPVAPKDTDSRVMWEDYATSPAVGMSEDQAKSYPNKGALIDAVTAKLNQK
jgi:hypothetical protein